MMIISLSINPFHFTVLIAFRFVSLKDREIESFHLLGYSQNVYNLRELKAGSQERNPGLLCGWQEANFCLLGTALPGRWSR